MNNEMTQCHVELLVTISYSFSLLNYTDFNENMFKYSKKFRRYVGFKVIRAGVVKNSGFWNT
jgi:hypothetical protein